LDKLFEKSSPNISKTFSNCKISFYLKLQFCKQNVLKNNHFALKFFITIIIPLFNKYLKFFEKGAGQTFFTKKFARITIF